MHFEILSHRGAGPLRFGMTPDQVRSSVGVPFENFKRIPASAYPCDHFLSIQAFAYYTSDGIAEAFEFARPASIGFKDVNLLALGFEKIIELLSLDDPQLKVEPDGFVSLQLGIGGYAPECENDPSQPPESIIVFAQGYYD